MPMLLLTMEELVVANESIHEQTCYAFQMPEILTKAVLSLPRCDMVAM